MNIIKMLRRYQQKQYPNLLCILITKGVYNIPYCNIAVLFNDNYTPIIDRHYFSKTPRHLLNKQSSFLTTL